MHTQQRNVILKHQSFSAGDELGKVDFQYGAQKKQVSIAITAESKGNMHTLHKQIARFEILEHLENALKWIRNDNEAKIKS